MSIIKTITDGYEFWNWLQNSHGYKDKFTVAGAWAIQDYIEKNSYELSDTHNVEFDPIAWCCEFSEYDDYADAWEQLGGGGEFIEGEELAIDDNIKLWLENNTTVIELDNGGVVVGEF